MVCITWLLSILTSLILFIVYRDVITYKIGGIALAVIAIYSLSHVAIIKDNMTEDTEWWGNYAVSVHYYDDWDEEVPCRHSYSCNCHTDSKGNEHCSTCYMHSYDVDYHPEHWTMRFDNGSEKEISHSDYIYWTTLWKSKLYKVELNRDYHKNDGDDMAGDWDLKPENSETIITQHEYENRVQASNSVFKADKVDSTDIAQYHLYQYPKCDGKQQIILGSVQVDPTTDRLLQYINGYYGSKKQFKLFTCIWRNQSEVTAERQHSYWDNLNKNEFLVCIGLDDSNQIQWCKTYSWMDQPVLGVKVEQYFRDHKSLSLSQFVRWLPSNIEEYWQRKHFRDFNYLQVDISFSDYLVIAVVVFILSIIQAIVTVKIINDLKNNPYKYRY